MSRRSFTVRATVRAVIALALSASLALALQPPSASPHAQLKLVDGTLSMSNSKAGAAILSASDMRPGDTATGSVTIANTGSAAGEFTLSSFDVTDVPGRGGGLLSTALVATVTDVTDPSAARRVYSGSLGAMTARALGSFAPGSQHTYHFSVGLPNGGGTALDAVQGGSVSVGYRWTASTSSGTTTGTTTTPTPTTTGPTPPPPTTTGPTPPPPTTTTPNPPTGLAPFRLKLTGKGKWSARKRGGPKVTARCSRTCSMRAAVKVRGTGRKLALKVKSKPMASAAGRATQFQIVLNKKSVKKIRRSIKRHKRVKIAVTVTAIDQFKLIAKGKKVIRVKR
jgi:spore coat-associated protein N